jgi:hypothetical protein|tara:strand:+ start:1952 stop:2080 length:129 start_codon:yes stop_codon:yes gene_type:complete
MKLTLETSEADAEEVIELAKRLVEAIDKLEELVERMEQMQGE